MALIFAHIYVHTRNKIATTTTCGKRTAGYKTREEVGRPGAERGPDWLCRVGEGGDGERT